MKVVGKIFAVLYTIIFTLVTLVLVLIFTVSGYLKGNFYTNLITSDSFMNSKLSELSLDFDGKEEITELCGEDCTVEDAVIKAASEGFGIDGELVKEALNDKDIQKVLGDVVGVVISFETTGVAEKLDYKDYKKVLNKEISKKILSQLELTNEDIKQVIEQYNESIDTNYNYKGGFVNEQQSIAY